MDGTARIFERELPRREANHRPLTPLDFLSWSETTFGARTGVVYGGARWTWSEVGARCRRLASGLAGLGVGRGDTVAILAPNTPPMLEAHYGVPMLGAVLNAINTRLDAATIAFILAHGEAKVLIADSEWSAVLGPALARLDRPIEVVDIVDPAAPGARHGRLTYDELLAAGDPELASPGPRDEWDALSLCYTSGTTGDPKGVVYHHRGAFLNALGNALIVGLQPESVYLWTLPMFHCNGWTFTWAVTAVGGTHVCLRKVEPAAIYAAIETAHVTHLCAAPVVLTMLLHAPAEVRRPIPGRVRIATGGAAPPSAVIEAMAAQGFEITHLYGLTETFGPATVCAGQAGWDRLPALERAAMLARQGVRYPTLAELEVVAPESLAPVPPDGRTLGEIVVRGNTVMTGYLKNPRATAEAFRGGWYHTGDLAVRHPDRYVEVKDRAKDVIISGGENISSLELEEVLYRHPAVMEAAVVAQPDARWGESPCAFVTLRPDAPPTDAAQLIAWVKARVAGFKAIRRVVFGPLPKTSTGKVQKHELRARAAATAAPPVAGGLSR